MAIPNLDCGWDRPRSTFGASGPTRLARRFGSDRRGAGAAEFALVLPVFTLMVMAGLQFGWAQHSAGSVNYALEEASRALLLNPSLDEAALRAMVLAELDPGTAAKVSVSVVREAAGVGEVARLTGVYVQQIGLPTLAALPFNYTRTVVTPLPASP